MRDGPSVWRALVSMVAFSLAGCSALAPQITPERLIQRPGDTGRKPPTTLEEAYDSAAELQRLYATAVMEQGNATPQLSAGLLGLSAITLFKGITGANTRDVAGAGVLGSAAWAAHSSLISQPRLEVYRAGVDALQCAMAAVAPLKPGQNRLGAPSDAEGHGTLYGRLGAADSQRDALRALLSRNALLKESRPRVTQAFRKADRITVLEKPVCRNPGPNASAVGLLAHQRCLDQPSRPVTKLIPERKQETLNEAPPASLLSAFTEAESEFAHAETRIAAAEVVIRTLEDAAPALWTKTVAIHNVVSREVQQTTPNIASVLAAVKGMKDMALGFGGTPAAPQAQTPIFQAESEQAMRSASADDIKATRELRAAAAELRLKVLALDQIARRALGTGHEQARAELSRCAVKASGVTLTVTPAGDRRDLPVGTPGVFFVTGGSGVPLASVVSGPRSASIALQPEGGLVRYVFTPPSAAVAGEEYTVRFSDGGGSGVEQFVVVKLVAAPPAQPAPAGTAAATANSSSTTAPPAPTGSRTVFFSMSDAELRLLKLERTASDEAVRAKLQACKQSAGETHVLKTLKIDSELKPAVIKALQAVPPQCTLP